MLKNTVVLITGASSGIGEACAHRFAESGAHVLLCARRVAVLKKLCETIEKKYKTQAHYFECDVSDHAQIKNTLAALNSEWKNIDVLINNAGFALGIDAMQNANVDDWEKMLQTNVMGLLYMTREILPNMIARNHGHIINVGSIAGHSVYPGGVVYCATKHAVRALSQGLRMDLLGTKIRVSSVDPGAVETNFSVVRFKGDRDRAKKLYDGYDPLCANDIADVILYCATRSVRVNIAEVLIMPTDQAAANMIARREK